MPKTVLSMLALLVLSAAQLAIAGNPWKNPDQSLNKGSPKVEARLEVRFSNYDREVISQYYRYANRAGLPPGLAKKGKLPPGLQKQIARKGKLPPGLQAKYLPYELERRLDKLPQNQVRLRVGADIVLMDIPTKIILDVIKDISL